MKWEPRKNFTKVESLLLSSCAHVNCPPFCREAFGNKKRIHLVLKASRKWAFDWNNGYIAHIGYFLFVVACHSVGKHLMTKREYTLLWKRWENEPWIEIIAILPTSDILYFVVSCGYISHLLVLPSSVFYKLCPCRLFLSLF